MDDMAECTCGFDGANSLTTTPDWRIIKRSSDGSVVSNMTFIGNNIIRDQDDGLEWVIGQVNSTSSPNSRLVVGPVNEAHNQSSYQCVFNVNQNINGSTQIRTVMSSVGILTVVGKNLSFTQFIFIHTTDLPSIGNILVDKTCAASLSVTWDTHFHSACEIWMQLVTISSSTTSTFTTNDTNFTFTNLNSNTTYTVTVTLRFKRNGITSRFTTVKTSPLYCACSTINFCSHYINCNVSYILTILHYCVQ